MVKTSFQVTILIYISLQKKTGHKVIKSKIIDTAFNKVNSAAHLTLVIDFLSQLPSTR